MLDLRTHQGALESNNAAYLVGRDLVAGDSELYSRIPESYRRLAETAFSVCSATLESPHGIVRIALRDDETRTLGRVCLDVDDISTGTCIPKLLPEIVRLLLSLIVKEQASSLYQYAQGQLDLVESDYIKRRFGAVFGVAKGEDISLDVTNLGWGLEVSINLLNSGYSAKFVDNPYLGLIEFRLEQIRRH